MIPICVSPYPDELWFSYVRRLAVLNGYERIYEFEQFYLCTGIFAKAENDSYCNLVMLSRRYRDSPTFPDISRILEMDTFYVDVDGLSIYEQAKLSESILFDSGIRSKRKRHRYRDFRICPSCLLEDMTKYGEAYLHVQHHFKDVKICYKHHVPLHTIENLNAQTRRNKNAFLGKKKDVIQIENMEQEIKKIDTLVKIYKENQKTILKIHMCPKCGTGFLAHPYSLQTGLLCPVCNENKKIKDKLQERLDHIYDGEYEISEFKGSLTLASIQHKPCGSIRKNISALIWHPKSDCLNCKRLTIESLQERINTHRSDLTVIDALRNDNNKCTSVKVRHSCGREFITSKQQLIYFTCPVCSGRQIDLETVDREYKLVNDVMENNHVPIAITHLKCGYTFYTSKSAFLAGSRCPLCMPRYSYEMVTQALEVCLEGTVSVTKSTSRGYVDVQYNETSLTHISYQKIMNDLQSENPKIFTLRKMRYIPEQPKKSTIYNTISFYTSKNGYWTFADGIPGLNMDRITRNMVQKMTNAGYLTRIEKGKYKTNVTENQDINKN